jgi:hypothetical protein
MIAAKNQAAQTNHVATSTATVSVRLTTAAKPVQSPCLGPSFSTV